MKYSLFLLLSLFISTITAISQPRLIKDISEGAESSFDFSKPENDGLMARTKEHLYFYITKNSNVQIWETNILSNETKMVLERPFLTEYAVYNNEIYVVSHTATKSYLGKINDQSEYLDLLNNFAGFSKMLSFNGKLFFINDVTLMSIDSVGSTENIYAFSSFSGVRDFVIFDNTIYLIAGDNEGTKLFKSDGKQGKPLALKTLTTGSEFNQRLYMTVAENNLFFFYKKSGGPYQLLAYNSISNTLTELKIFEELFFNDLKKENSIIGFQNKLIFKSRIVGESDKMFESNGTVSGTKQLLDKIPFNFYVYNNRLYFLSSANQGNRLYAYAGLGLPNTILNNILLDATPIINHDNLLIFSAKSGTENYEIYQYDVVAKTLLKLTNFTKDSIHVNPRDFLAADSTIYFTANGPFGRELYGLTVKLLSNSEGFLYPKNDIKVFPNPFSDKLNIEFNLGNEASYILINSIGSIVMRGKITNSKESIASEELPSGIYSLIIYVKSNTLTTQLVKI